MPSEGQLRAMLDIVTTIGPATIALVLLLALGAFFYRRDFLRRQHGLAEAHARRDKRDERLTTAVDAMLESRIEDRAVQRELAKAIDRLSATAQANSERLSEALGYIRGSR